MVLYLLLYQSFMLGIIIVSFECHVIVMPMYVYNSYDY